MIHALSVTNAQEKEELNQLLQTNSEDKVSRVLKIYADCKVAEWASTLKENYFNIAMKHLEELAVSNSRKAELEKLARYLLQRES